MNIIISAFFIISIIFSFIFPNEASIFSIITDSLESCSTLVIKLMFITAFYSGIMRVAKDSKMLDKLGFIIKKLSGKIFKTKNKDILEKITMNISANIIGIGNAATPMGLMAMKGLDEENNSLYPSYDMCKFMIFNTCSVQLIPTTIISLRALEKSQNPSIVVLPIIITSIASLIFGLLITKILYKLKRGADN